MSNVNTSTGSVLLPWQSTEVSISVMFCKSCDGALTFATEECVNGLYETGKKKGSLAGLFCKCGQR